MNLLKRWRKRFRAVIRRDAVERELDEELAFHLEMETEKNIREGLDPKEARRQAAIKFGGVERYKEKVREARTLGWVPGMSLDFKLGVRMLAKYPGLTIVGVVSMAFAIFIGVATFEVMNKMVDPTLPLPGGERIVGIRYWDRAENEMVLPRHAELGVWRKELSAIELLGGFQRVQRDLSVRGEPGEPVQVIWISAAAFRIAEVLPLLGRTLVEGDESPGAPPVLVLGHRLWQVRFGSDPSVLGRTVRLGGVGVTVVGVMPERFGFPKEDNLWVPLPSEEGSGIAFPGEELTVFGRLAPGATLKSAQLEARTLSTGSTWETFGRQEHMTLEVLPYVESLSSVRMGLFLRALLYQVNLYPALFLILVCGNIGLLMFARAAARRREIVVRNALGASRGRIVTQLFIEALVLGTLAATIGLAATSPALQWLLDRHHQVGISFPFWVNADISPTTMIYAVFLTLLGAAVAGVIPALKATGRGLKAGLSQVSTGAGGLRMGGIWSAVIVSQIAATVVFTGVAHLVTGQARRNASVEPYFPPEQYVGIRILMEWDSAEPGTGGGNEEFLRRFADNVRELKRRFAEDPAVTGVTLADRLPVQARGFDRIEVDQGGRAPLGTARQGHRARSDAVDLLFLDVFRAPVISGRKFDPSDLEGGVNTVVVNASFVEEILGGRNAIGRRIRYVKSDRSTEPGPWYEIVGVAGDLVADQMRAMDTFEPPPKARVYHPLDQDRAGTYPLLYAILHVPSGTETLAPKLHTMAGAVSPALRLEGIKTLDRADGDIAFFWRLFAYLALLVNGIALFLSLAGTYAVMSFTVARRTREIGVRVALGAGAARVISDSLRRPIAQIGTGVSLGCLVMGALVWRFSENRVAAGDAVWLLMLGLSLVGVCTLACMVPIRRALRIEPTEAMRVDG